MDEAHHLLSPFAGKVALSLPQKFTNIILITVHPDQIAPDVLGHVNTVIAVGKGPERTISSFTGVIGENSPDVETTELQKGEVLLWIRDTPRAIRVAYEPPKGERRRHSRKYAEGELPPELSFYFRGPGEKLNLRAHNLLYFLELADGVDDETWVHHLESGDYARWFQEAIKDEELAEAAKGIASSGGDPKDTRAAIRAEIEQRYTLPERQPSGIYEQETMQATD
jgi:hypothetical protein